MNIYLHPWKAQPYEVNLKRKHHIAWIMELFELPQNFEPHQNFKPIGHLLKHCTAMNSYYHVIAIV